MSTNRIKELSNGLRKYYESQGWDYNQGFITYCNDNGIDDGTLDQDFAEKNPLDATIIEYFIDPNNSDKYIFPYPSNEQSSKQQQAQFIIKILKECDKQKFC